MKRMLIGIAIDILKWSREPLFRFYQMICRLRLSSSNRLAALQFRYHALRKRER